jgi:hypothetical protein
MKQEQRDCTIQKYTKTVVQTGQYEIEMVNKFIYLGNMINDTKTENQEIQRRINYTNGIYFSLMYVSKSQNAHRKTKIQIYKTSPNVQMRNVVPFTKGRE